ncbi:MAG: hypothetical protein IJ877_03775 [Candidatus Gastranaerophilales bacterium]|nr:hypothetical protein [Candidatus Gastranaerophilales bacterium]
MTEIKILKFISKHFIAIVPYCLIVLCLLSLPVNAGVLDECYKIYSVDADNLYMSALNVLSSNGRFEISEIQTKNGYILFSTGSKYYLLTVTRRYKNQSEVKVLPQNSDYSQGSSVASAIFNLLDSEIKKPMELVK